MKDLGISWQFIISKIDRMKGGKVAEEARFTQAVNLMVKYGGVSDTALPVSSKRKRGITELRAAILQACGYEPYL